MLDGDSDAIVALLGGDFSRPHQFIRVAEAMAEFGRDDGSDRVGPARDRSDDRLADRSALRPGLRGPQPARREVEALALRRAQHERIRQLHLPSAAHRRRGHPMSLVRWRAKLRAGWSRGAQPRRLGRFYAISRRRRRARLADGDLAAGASTFGEACPAAVGRRVESESAQALPVDSAGHRQHLGNAPTGAPILARSGCSRGA